MGFFSRVFTIAVSMLVTGLIGANQVLAAEPELSATASQAKPMTVTVVGSACVAGARAHGMVEDDALADARRKGREYAVNEIESKTTLENGAPDTDLMAAYNEGTLREIGQVKRVWSSDPTQGDCCEVQVRLELTPKLNRTVIKPIKNKVTKGVYIESDPPGAEVFIDRLYQGNAPIHNLKIRTGRHDLEVGKVPGYQVYQGYFEVKSGQPWKYRVVLGKRDAPADTHSNSTPPASEINGSGVGPAAGKIAGNPATATALTPPPAFAAPVLEPRVLATPVVAQPAGSLVVAPPVVDTPQWVAVKVMTEPVSTKIYLDDKYIGDSPAEFLALVGSHRLRLIPVFSTNYQIIEKEIDVNNNHLNVLFLRLDSK